MSIYWEINFIDEQTLLGNDYHISVLNVFWIKIFFQDTIMALILFNY